MMLRITLVLFMCLFFAGCSSTQKKTCSPVSPERKASVKSAELDESMTSRQIQMALKAGGYYSGEIDGILGPRSREAIRKFQQDQGLVDDSIAGPRTQAVLRDYLPEMKK
jgi:peptidoglycan hydrolase-like protein with peptidoglycan-binding domain